MDCERRFFEASRNGEFPILKKVLNGKSKEQVSSLVSARTNGSTPLGIACRNGHLDVATYLVEICRADIEQVGSVTILDQNIIEAAPPLFCAAVAGHLSIVKMLVKNNASVNSTMETNSPTLRAACYYGQFEIVKYLIQHGANIEEANKDGGTCLMSSCSEGYYELSKYLLECGALINRKTVEGETALHCCAASGSLNTLKMLLQSGAEFQSDSYGITPLLTAAVYGHSEVVEYFINELNFTNQEKINALELLGSGLIKENLHMENTFDCWKCALFLRYEYDEYPLEKPIIRSSIAFCVGANEVRTLQQLEELATDPDEMSVQALLVVERILGASHRLTILYIIRTALRYADNGNLNGFMQLFLYALDDYQKDQEPLNSKTQGILLSLVLIFSFVMQGYWLLERAFKPVTFKDILAVFKICLKKIETDFNVPETQKGTNYTNHFHRTLIVSIHLIGLMCRLQPELNKYEDTELKKVVYKFVHLNPKTSNGWTSLHLACCRDSSSLGLTQSSIIEFPSPEIVNLLLEVGACPNAVDSSNNTPLHIAAMNMPCSPSVFKALLNHGAHLDFCNYERKTPFQLANILSLLDASPIHYINLQCLCAQVIRNCKIAYEGIVHENLKVFLDSH